MIVLDSDVLIGFLNSHRKAVQAMEALEAAGEALATTSINVAEILRGCGGDATRQRILAESLLSGLTEVPFGPRAARRFATMMSGADRLGQPVPVADAMVAAAALEAGARIATFNTRDFERMPGVELVDL